MKLLVASAIGAFALGVAFAPLAQADQDAFITTLANNGWSGPVETAMAVGNEVCSDIAAGVPESDTLQKISDNTTDGVEPKDAKFFYDAAAANLC